MKGSALYGEARIMLESKRIDMRSLIKTNKRWEMIKMKFVYATISVKNLDKSLTFYRDLIGLPENRRFKAGPDTEIVFLGSGETEVELIYNTKQNAVSFGRDISLGFETSSLDETLKLMKENNVETGEVFSPAPGVRMFFVSDPNGLRIQFVEYSGEAAR